MLMTIGAVALEVWPLNITDTSRSTGGEFAEKAIMGRRPVLEFVGEAAETLGLSAKLFPAKLGGLAELDNLHAIRTSGLPQYVMRGDGTPLGWFVLAELSENSTHLDGRGVGQVIEINITLKRTDGPQDADFHASANVN